MDADRIIGVIVDWAKAQPAIEAVAVVGSYARGTARADSDIDLVLLTTRPREFRTDTAWLDAIHWSAVGARPMRWEGENYGGLWSLRLWLEQDGGEIEFGFASPSWANVKGNSIGCQERVKVYLPTRRKRELSHVLLFRPATKIWK